MSKLSRTPGGLAKITAETPSVPFKAESKLTERLKPPRAPRQSVMQTDHNGVPIVAPSEAIGDVKLTPGLAWAVRKMLELRIPLNEAERFIKNEWRGRVIGQELNSLLRGYAAALKIHSETSPIRIITK